MTTAAPTFAAYQTGCQPAACKPAPAAPATPTWPAAKAAAAPQAKPAEPSLVSVATATPGDLPRLPSDASLPGLAGVKRSHASAFEPFPLGGPARHVLARRAADARAGMAAAHSPATSSDRSESASVHDAAVAAAPQPDSATSAPAGGGTHGELLLRLAFRLLPRLEPPAAALLLAQMRAVIQRGRASAAARGAPAPQPAAAPAARPGTGR